MKLINIDRDKFNELTKDLPYANFHQTANWATLKEHTGWKGYFLGYYDEDRLVAATMLLRKKIPFFKKYLFYAPRGYLIDFNNAELLKSFTKDLLAYIKKENGFELLIDPYIEYQHHDINGDIVDDGFNNQEVVDTLLNLGFHHNNGFNLYNENLQPRWIYTLTLKDKIYKEILKGFANGNRGHIKKKDFYAITTRELNRDEINLYKDVMEHTANRRGFIDRPLKYYENMYDAMHDDGILHYYINEINYDQAISNLTDALKKSEETLEALRGRENHNKRTENEIKEEEIRHKSLVKNFGLLKEYGKNAKTHVLSGITLLTYGNEAVMLFAGNYDDFKLLSSSPLLVNDLIKLSLEQGYERYNFYGITGDFDDSNPLNGLYVFKKSFGGQVVELIGEFEYVLSKPTKLFYELGLKVYNLTKKVKH